MQNGHQKSGFIKVNRSYEAEELLKRPNELALLFLIALRAKWKDGLSVNGLEPGEALIGDYKKCGLTHRQYRTALKNLIKYGQISTIKATNKGTIVKLINSDIFDINCSSAVNQRDNIESIQRQPGDNPETNAYYKKKGKKGKKEKKDTTDPLHDYLYPDWLNKELWFEFAEMRADNKWKISSKTGITRLLNKIKRFMDDGYSQEEIIGRSLELTYRGIWEPKDEKSANNLTSAEKKEREDICRDLGIE